MGVIGRRDEYQCVFAPLQDLLDLLQPVLVECARRGERVLRQAVYGDSLHSRRSRCRVMPICSPASAIASLTIFTVTASILLSCRNRVSHT